MEVLLSIDIFQSIAIALIVIVLIFNTLTIRSILNILERKKNI